MLLKKSVCLQQIPVQHIKMAKIVGRDKDQSGNKWCNCLVAYDRLCNSPVQVTHQLSQRDGTVRQNRARYCFLLLQTFDQFKTVCNYQSN
jgi:hypothetical protein